jgi:hypothetical protein
MQGIFPIQPIFAKNCLEYTCKRNGLQKNSLSTEQGIFSRVQGISSGFWPAQGI